MKNGNICIGTIIDNKCDKGIKVDITGEVPKEGKINLILNRNIYYSGKVSDVYANYAGFGVRPVITLEM